MSSLPQRLARERVLGTMPPMVAELQAARRIGPRVACRKGGDHVAWPNSFDSSIVRVWENCPDINSAVWGIWVRPQLRLWAKLSTAEFVGKRTRLFPAMRVT